MDPDFPRKQEALRQAMRIDTDPRWFDRQAEPGPEHKPIAVWKIVGAFCLVALLAVAGISIARAAERDRPHDLWLLVKPTATEPPAADQQRNIFKIGTGYASRARCEDVKKAMRKVAGTLQCLP